MCLISVRLSTKLTLDVMFFNFKNYLTKFIKLVKVNFLLSMKILFVLEFCLVKFHLFDLLIFLTQIYRFFVKLILN